MSQLHLDHPSDSKLRVVSLDTTCDVEIILYYPLSAHLYVAPIDAQTPYRMFCTNYVVLNLQEKQFISKFQGKELFCTNDRFDSRKAIETWIDTNVIMLFGPQSDHIVYSCQFALNCNSELSLVGMVSRSGGLKLLTSQIPAHWKTFETYCRFTSVIVDSFSKNIEYFGVYLGERSARKVTKISYEKIPENLQRIRLVGEEDCSDIVPFLFDQNLVWNTFKRVKFTISKKMLMKPVNKAFDITWFEECAEIEYRTSVKQ